MRLAPFAPGIEDRILGLILPIQQEEFHVPITAEAQMKAAHRFYEKNGFRALGKEGLPPDYPRMAVDNRFYVLDLHGRPR